MNNNNPHIAKYQKFKKYKRRCMIVGGLCITVGAVLYFISLMSVPEIEITLPNALQFLEESRINPIDNAGK